VIVRHDVDLETIGEIADLPPDSSPIQIGTTGAVDERGFTVVGRIVYEYEDGGWNEWHLAYADGTSGWLSDAQLEFAVSSLVQPSQPLPAASAVALGQAYAWNDRTLEVTTLTTARYKGVEGELPFEYWGKEDVLFADLRGHDATFGTIDYSDGAPILFIGRFVSFDELHLRELRTFETADGSRAMQGFNCVNCGAAVELRALSHTRAVACTSCGAVIDARDRNVTILQTAEARQFITPLIPLGTRGTWHEQPHDVIGYQQRSIEADFQRFRWDEYVLFNPYHGFRYLTYYNGHWSDVAVIRERPEIDSVGSRPAMRYAGKAYAHFQHAEARTDYVLGEFPWRVRVGEKVVTDDYVAPPFMLSSEGTDAERTWSLGQYTSPATVKAAFPMPVAPPDPIGVFASQPNPYTEKSSALWRAFRWLLLLTVVLFAYRQITADREVVFRTGYTYLPGAAESSFVTPPFRMKAPGTVDIRITTSLANSWLGFDLAMIDLASGEAYNVGTEVSYYAGVEDGESWAEGSTSSLTSLPRLPAGEYYLRVEPEGPANGPAVPYTITVRRDVPALWPYLVALLVLPLRPLWVWFRKVGFEASRDAEGDYGASDSSEDSGGSGDDDDDDSSSSDDD
jgi:hypothetical protein